MFTQEELVEEIAELQKEIEELKEMLKEAEETRDGYDQDRQDYRGVLLKVQEDINWVI